jgi:hypothetical protein
VSPTKPVTPHSARTRQLMSEGSNALPRGGAATREDVVQLSLHITELRRARDEVVTRLKAAEAQLDAAPFANPLHPRRSEREQLRRAQADSPHTPALEGAPSHT